MTANVGGIDRAIRIIAGLAILSLFFVLDGPNRWWAVAGLVLLGTGLVAWCPVYLPFGFRSNKTR